MKNLDLFGGETRVIQPEKETAYTKFRREYNYHKGTKPKRCRECKYLHVNQYANTYYKCQLQGITGNPATDIRVNNTCDQWEPGY